jgi:hypothetical protein
MYELGSKQPMSPLNKVNESLAAIVCEHVATGEEPILLAVRTTPEDPDDSGWQFLCSSGKEESTEEAKVWLLSEVLERSPDLAAWLDSSVGTRLERSSGKSPWREVGTG